MKDKISLPKEKDIKIQKSWGDISPETKIETPKPFKKSRSSEKQALKRILRDIEDWDDLDI